MTAQAEAFSLLKAKGYPDHVAAALVGNMVQESGPKLNTRAVGDGGNSFGAVQWNGPRKDSFMRWAAANERDIYDLGTQIEFLDYEMRGPERKAYDAIMAAPDVRSATLAASNRYWRPGDPWNNNRIRYAEDVMRIAGGEGGDAIAKRPAFDPEKFRQVLEGSAPASEGGTADSTSGDVAESARPVFDPERFRRVLGGESGEVAPTEAPTPDGGVSVRATPAFDAFIAKHHPNATPEHVERLRVQMSNPAREGGAAAGFMFPFADEAAAAIGAGIQNVGKLFTDEDTSFGDDYGKALDQTRDYLAAVDELQGAADEVLGGAAMVGGGLAGGGTKLLSASTRAGQYAKGAMVGSGGGALYGAGEGEGVVDRAGRAVEGGAWGAAGGVMGTTVGNVIEALAKRYGPGVARLLGRGEGVRPDGTLSPELSQKLRDAGVNPDEVTAEFSRAFEARSRELPGDQAARAAALDAMNIPGTRGQITGDVTQQAVEEGMRAGAGGGQSAANTMRQFDETQRGAVASARDRIGTGLGGGRMAADDAVEASGRALQGVQRKADEAKALAQSFYRESEAAGVKIRPESFDNLMVRIDDRLASAEVIVDEATPVANRMLRVLRSRSTRPPGVEGLSPDGSALAAPGRSGGGQGVSLELVDNTRSRISKALRDARQRGDTAETEALSEILGGMDDWLDDAVDAALYDAGPEALESLKTARKLWAEYRKQFFGKKGADRFIRKMVEDEASPRDVFAWLYSQGRMGGNRQSTEFAARLRNVLGPDSDEWAALRQGAWTKLTSGDGAARQPGPQKVAENILGFITGETRSLARLMFSPEEIKQMLVYARAQKAMVPQGKATNPSGSSYDLRRAGEAAFRHLAEMIGFGAGGLEGAVAAGAAARGATSGGGWLRAKAAVAGVPGIRSGVPAALGAEAGIAQGAR